MSLQRLQLRRLQGEGTGNLPQFPATLKHAVATVNTDISMYFEVYGGFRSHPSG